MQDRIMYIELKTGFSDDGPAWIRKVRFSKSSQTIYFNDQAFKKINGISGNYMDIETGDEYWISGVKKNGADRHWAGKGRIQIERKIIDQYLEITGQTSIDSKRLEVVEDK